MYLHVIAKLELQNLQFKVLRATYAKAINVLTTYGKARSTVHGHSVEKSRGNNDVAVFLDRYHCN